MTKETPHGLGASTASGSQLFLPLQSVSVDAFIFDVSALVELKQKYVNSPGNGRLASARYVFPIPSNAAVCAFKMEDSSGRTVSGVVKETQKAKKEFEEAVSQGKFSGLAHEVKADIFSISIGAIPPGVDVEITLSYSVDIPEHESEMMDQIRFALPTFIGQRYGGAPAELSQARSDDRAALFSFNASVQLTSNILEITSPSHKSDIVVQQTQTIQSGATPLYGTNISLREPFPLDREFVLSIQAERLDLPRCIAEVNTADETVALMLTLVPRFGAPDVTAQEYIFIVDRSGSMASESRIDYARDALKHLMKGLPSNNTHFNIVSFGNHFSSLWRESVVYNRDNLTAAITHIDSMTANMGGTEIGGALDWAFLNRMINKPTAVFVLTDGEIWQPDPVINSVRQKVIDSGSTNFLRVFTIGIGNGASTALCSGLARVGNGVCFMTTRSEQIKGRCSKLLRAARALPHGNTCNLTVDWGYETVAHTPSKSTPISKAQAEAAPEPDPSKPIDFFDSSINPFAKTKGIGLQFELPQHPNVLQAPTQPPNFYPGNRFLVSAILSNTLQPPEKIILKGTLPGGLPVQIPVNVAYILGRNQERLPLLHTLAAKRFVRELEDGDIRALNMSVNGDKTMQRDIAKAAIIEYGVRYRLASRFTAFVAIVDGKDETKEMEELDVKEEAENIVDEDDWVVDFRDERERDRERERAELDEESDEDMAFNSGQMAAPSRVRPWIRPRISPAPSRIAALPSSTESPTNPFVATNVFGASLIPQATGYAGPPRPAAAPAPPQGRGIFLNRMRTQAQQRIQSRQEALSIDNSGPPGAGAGAAAPGNPFVEYTDGGQYKGLKQASLPGYDKHAGFEAAVPASDMRHNLMNMGFGGGGPATLSSPPPPPPLRMAMAAPAPPPPMMRKRAALPEPAEKAKLANMMFGSTSAAMTGPSAAAQPAADPISELADLQSHDGSFAFDGKLLALLQRKKGSLSLEGLKTAIPASLQSASDEDTVWATVLAAAYMLVALADKRSVWDSLWDKAQESVCQTLSIRPYQFNQLVQAASAELQ